MGMEVGALQTLPGDYKQEDHQSRSRSRESSPRRERGRTRTIFPIVSDSPQFQAHQQQRRSSVDMVDMVLENLDEVEGIELGIGAGGTGLGVRQAERVGITPSGTPPPSPPAMCEVGGGAERSEPVDVPMNGREEYVDIIERRRRRSASPRMTPPMRVVSIADIASLSPSTQTGGYDDEMLGGASPDLSTVRRMEDQAIEMALGDAMESSLILPPVAVQTAVITATNDKVTAKRKHEEEGEGDGGGVGKQRRTNTSTKAVVPLLLERPGTAMSNRSTRSISITKKPSIDHLMDGFVPVAVSSDTTRDTRVKVGRGSGTVRSTSNMVLQRSLSLKGASTAKLGNPLVTPDQKVMPSLVRSVTNVVMISPERVDTIGEDGRKDTIGKARSASISLKRIQDNDMETIMAASATIISRGGESPASHVKASCRSENGNGDSWEALHHQNVLQRAKSLGNTWIKGRRPALLGKVSRGGVGSESRTSTAPYTPSRDPLTHLHRAVSYATNPSTRKVSPAERRGNTARASSTDSTHHYTRWDGTRTPITQEGHPVHWAALKQHHLVRQRSRQSLKNKRSVDSTNDVFAASQVRGLEIPLTSGLKALYQPPVASPTPPVSINRWNLPGTRKDSKAPSVTPSPTDERRPSLLQTQTLVLPSSNLNPGQTSPFYSSSNHSHESLDGMDHVRSRRSGSLASSFDSKAAYEAAKAEEGLISFDQVLGLNG